jgi:hypothetical protein
MSYSLALPLLLLVILSALAARAQAGRDAGAGRGPTVGLTELGRYGFQVDGANRIDPRNADMERMQVSLHARVDSVIRFTAKRVSVF